MNVLNIKRSSEPKRMSDKEVAHRVLLVLLFMGMTVFITWTLFLALVGLATPVKYYYCPVSLMSCGIFNPWKPLDYFYCIENFDHEQGGLVDITCYEIIEEPHMEVAHHFVGQGFVSTYGK
jgi:hypothetical protein